MKKVSISILLIICFLTPSLLSASAPQAIVEYSLGQLSPTGGINKENYSDLIVDYETPALTKDRNGSLNRAYDIQNNEQYLRLQSFQSFGQELSLSLWVKFSKNSNNGAIYNIILDNDGKKTIIYLEKVEIWGNLDEWTLVGHSLKNKNRKAYFYNGEIMDRQIVHQRINLSKSTKVSFYLGNDNEQSFPFIGQISDLRIYDAALDINDFRLLKDQTYNVFKPEWQTVFLFEDNLLDIGKQNQLSFEQDYTQKQSKGQKSLNRYGNENTAIKLVSNQDSLYIPKSLMINESNQVSISIVFKTNHDDHLTFLKIVDQNNNIIFSIKDKIISINKVKKFLPKPLYSTLSKNLFNLMVVVFDLESNQVTLYVSEEKIGSYSIPNNSNKQFMKKLSYVQVVEISAAQENQSIIIDDIYIYDKVLDQNHVVDIKEWKIGKAKTQIYTSEFFRLNQDLLSESDLDQQLTYPTNYVKQYNEFENVYQFNSYNDFSVKNFFGNNPLQTKIYFFDFQNLAIWVRFDNNYDTADSIVAKITNGGVNKSFDFEFIIKRDSMQIQDKYNRINQTIPFTQSLNKQKGKFNLITLQYVEYRRFQVYVDNTLAGSYYGKLAFFQRFSYLQVGLILGQNFYGQMFNIRVINAAWSQNNHIEELKQLGTNQNDNFLTEVLDKPENEDKEKDKTNNINAGKDQNDKKDRKSKQNVQNLGQQNRNSLQNGQYGSKQAKVLSQCDEQLKNLQPKNVNIDFQMIENSNNIQHSYTINFGGLTLIESCFSIQARLANNPIDFSLSPDQKQVLIKFNNDDAISKGCKQVTPYELQCEFELQITYKNVPKMKKSFTSIVQANDLNNIQNGLQLQIIGDNSQKTVQSVVSTEVHLCTDADCSEYQDELILKRNETAYVELKVTSPQYQDLYPVHKSLKLGDEELKYKNQPNQQGRIIYQIKPNVASQNTLLQVQIKLVDNLNKLRLLSEDQSFINNDDMIRKQIFINIHENDKDSKKKGDQTALIVGVSLGSIVFVSLIISLIVYGILKVKKNKILQADSQSKSLPLVKTKVELKSKQSGNIDNKHLSDVATSQ